MIIPKYAVFAYAREVLRGHGIETISRQLAADFADQGCDARVLAGGACLAVMPINKPLVRGVSSETLSGLNLIEAVTETLHPYLLVRRASAQIRTADANFKVTAVLPEREIEGDRWCLMNASTDLDIAAVDVVLRFRRNIQDGLYEKVKNVVATWRPDRATKIRGKLALGNIRRDPDSLRMQVKGESDAWTWIDFYFWMRSQLDRSERPAEIRFASRTSS